MNDKELEKALKKDIERGINSGEYPELFNGNEVVQLMLQSQLLGRKEGRKQATSDLQEKIEKILSEFNLLRNDVRHTEGFKGGICLGIIRFVELKQEIQGVGEK